MSVNVLVDGLSLAAIPRGGVAAQLFWSLASFGGVGAVAFATIIRLAVLVDQGHVRTEAFLNGVAYVGYLWVGLLVWLFSLIWLPGYPLLIAVIAAVVLVSVSVTTLRGARDTSVEMDASEPKALPGLSYSQDAGGANPDSD